MRFFTGIEEKPLKLSIVISCIPTHHGSGEPGVYKLSQENVNPIPSIF